MCVNGQFPKSSDSSHMCTYVFKEFCQVFDVLQMYQSDILLLW